MRKLHVLGAALAALFALGVLTASSASAVTFLLAEWLAGAVGITTTQLVDIESGPNKILLGETIPLIGKIDILCAGIFDGSIGPNGADDITELLTLGGALVDLTPLAEPGLLCEDAKEPGTVACPEPLVWLDNLPWLTLAELMVDGTEEFFVDLITSSGAGEPGYHVVCMGTVLEDLCTAAEAITKLTNTAEGLDGEFAESFTELSGLKLANCEKAGIETLILEGLYFLLLTAGGTLTVSE
jgi:hypothetical protein